MKTPQDQQAIQDGMKDYEDDQDDYYGMNGIVLFYFDDEYWLPGYMPKEDTMINMSMILYTAIGAIIGIPFVFHLFKIVTAFWSQFI